MSAIPHDNRIVYSKVIDFINQSKEYFSSEEIYDYVGYDKYDTTKKRRVQSNISTIIKRLKDADVITPTGKKELFIVYKRTKDLVKGGLKKIEKSNFVKL